MIRSSLPKNNTTPTIICFFEFAIHEESSESCDIDSNICAFDSLELFPFLRKIQIDSYRIKALVIKKNNKKKFKKKKLNL